jgi:hypothetical protein
VWTVRQGDTLLGSIEVTGGDLPWLAGTWSPEAAFAEVSPLFDRELALLERDGEADDWARVYSSIWDAGICLCTPDGQVVPGFLLHIIEGNAVFRWHDEPVGG